MHHNTSAASTNHPSPATASSVSEKHRSSPDSSSYNGGVADVTTVGGGLAVDTERVDPSPVVWLWGGPNERGGPWCCEQTTFNQHQSTTTGM